MASKENNPPKQPKDKKQPKVKDLSKQLKDLKVQTPNDIYILLLGDKSVGKSTFINALANCMSFNKLQNATADKIKVLIRSCFTVKDKSSGYPLVHVGNLEGVDINHPDAFATDCIKTYVIPISGSSGRLHVIDTPGFGGPEMLYKNQEICEDILSYIAQLQELHGICCMFSPNESFKASTFFDFIVKEILSRIDKNAYNNLLFCFTKTKFTEFTPGEAWWTLNNLINKFNEDTKNPTKIEFGNRNTFCLENDFFKYLAAKQRGVDVDETLYERSWQHSFPEVGRLISYITGRPKAILLKNVTSINEATRLIINISQPVFDSLQLVHYNIALLERSKQDLSAPNLDLADLRSKMYRASMDWCVDALLQPAMICFHYACSEVFCGTPGRSVAGVRAKKICHLNCCLSKVPKDMIGPAELLESEKMDQNKCRECGCDYLSHVHLYYVFSWQQTVSFVAGDLETVSEIVLMKENLAKEIDELLEGYRKEQEELIKCLPMFANFLESTSILPYTCKYLEYITALIDRETHAAHTCKDSINILTQLTALEEQYRERKANYDAALECERKLRDDPNLRAIVTPNNIIDHVMKLYTLPLIGKKLKQLMKIQKNPRTKEFEKSVIKVDIITGKVNKDKANNETKKKSKEIKASNAQEGTSNEPEKKKFDEKKKKKETVNKTGGAECKPGSSQENQGNKKKDKKDNKKDGGNGKEKEARSDKLTTSKSSGYERKFNRNRGVPDTPPAYEDLFKKQQAIPSLLEGSYKPPHPPHSKHPPHSNSTTTTPHSHVSTPVAPTVEVKVYNHPVQADHQPPLYNNLYPGHNPYPNPGHPPPNPGNPHYGNPHPPSPGNQHYDNPHPPNPNYGNPHPLNPHNPHTPPSPGHPYYGPPHQAPAPPVGFNPGPSSHGPGPHPPPYQGPPHGPPYGGLPYQAPPYSSQGPHGGPHIPPHGTHGGPHETHGGPHGTLGGPRGGLHHGAHAGPHHGAHGGPHQGSGHHGPHGGLEHHYHGHGEPAQGPYHHGDCKQCKHHLKKENKKFKRAIKKKQKQEKKVMKANAKKGKSSSSSSSSSSSDSD